MLLTSIVLLGSVESARAQQLYELYLLSGSNNRYETQTHVVTTELCYWEGGGRATLTWYGQGSFANKIRFSTNVECRVTGLYKKGAERNLAGSCNSNTGNAALDIIQNAQCRDIQAQTYSRNVRLAGLRAELAQERARLDRLNRYLARYRQLQPQLTRIQKLKAKYDVQRARARELMEVDTDSELFEDPEILRSYQRTLEAEVRAAIVAKEEFFGALNAMKPQIYELKRLKDAAR